MRIYVGNLSYSSTDETLSALFAEFGEVSSSNVITDRETGRSRGFGFIEMPDENAARAAIEVLNGQDFEGRSLNINVARPREPRAGNDRPSW